MAFYARLGFEQTGSWPDGGDPSWIEIRRDAAVLRFYADAPVGTPESPVMSGTVNLPCSDIEELAAEIGDRVDFARGPETMAYGQREFAVRDPDGYFIAFAQPG